MYPATSCCRLKWNASRASFLSACQRIFSCGVIVRRRSRARSSFSRVTNWFLVTFTSPPGPLSLLERGNQNQPSAFPFLFPIAGEGESESVICSLLLVPLSRRERG